MNSPSDTPSWPQPKRIRTHLGDIEYHDTGQGPVLVFVHLVLADASHWDKMVPLLADRFRCILPTLPMGAHRIPADPGADLSVEGLARAVADLMDHLGVDDVTVVGNDSGGAIAQILAARYPARLGRVVLTNCDMYDDFPPKLFAYLRAMPYVPGGMRLMGRALKARAFWKLPFVFGRLTNDVDATKINRWAGALLADNQIRRDASTVIKGFGPDVTNAAASALRSTTLPILVAWGADDKAFTPELAQRFCREVAAAKLAMIDNCKAFVCWDQPERLAELIVDFVPSPTA